MMTRALIATTLLAVALFEGVLSLSPPATKPGTCPPGRLYHRGYGRRSCLRTCRNDYQCRGDEKCCGSGWRKCCTDPIVATISTQTTTLRPKNNDVCPPTELVPISECAVRGTFSECRTNDDCGRNKVCCTLDSCGASECRAKTASGGVCPPPEPFKPICRVTLPVFECNVRNGNADCQRGQTCCRGGPCGGTQCLPRRPPATTTVKPLSGVCPAPEPFDPDFCARVGTLIECNLRNGNADCQRGQTCCAVGPCGGTSCLPRRTQTTTTPKPTPGVCPPSPVFDPEECQLVDPFLECNEDSDCDGNKICCTTGICGGTTCEPGPITRATPPTPPSNPLCPAVADPLPNRCKFSRFGPQCFLNNKKCKDGQTCCQTTDRCGQWSCVDLLTPRCPIQSPPQPVPDICTRARFSSNCNNDSDCSGRQICCINECNVKNCQDPPRRKY